jgi:hypothetical protein
MNKDKKLDIIKENASEEQINLLYELFSMMIGTTKGELMNLAFDNDTTNIDSAIPHETSEYFRNNYPYLDQRMFVVSYRNSETKMLNVNDLIIKKILTTN